MSFQVSPAVNVSEIDLTTAVPVVSTTEAGIAGLFRWGPVEQRVLIDSVDYLAQRFGKPTNYNGETFFSAAAPLAYGNKLIVVRAANTTETLSATANVGAVANNPGVKNLSDFETRSSFDANVVYIAKYVGSLGNSLKVSVCDSPNAYSQNVFNANSTTANVGGFSVNFIVGSNTANLVTSSSSDANTVATGTGALLRVGEILRVGNSSVGYQDLKVSSLSISTANVVLNFDRTFALPANMVANSTTANGSAIIVDRYWEFYRNVDRAPGTSKYASDKGGAGDELHVAIIDSNGDFTGIKGQILEVWEGLSRGVDAVRENGEGNYYKTVINYNSQYAWVAADRAGAASNTATNITQIDSKPLSLQMVGGADGASTEANVAISTLTAAWDLFASSEDVDVSLLVGGKARGGEANTQLANYIIDNILEVRKDCVGFFSPSKELVVNVPETQATDGAVQFRNALHNSSYAVLDSGYKYTYDKYNDVYRYVPLNGDMVGLAIRTDSVRDPWFSPAGYNRGMIKNVVKLSYNPRKAYRDILYKSDVNPVVTFPGQGVLLFGDKTLLGRSSAFDRINVRRLFIVLEKAISTAAKYSLFELNDEFTRAQFRNMVEPFLRDVQGRRGIYDFRVVCDGTNNTPEVIDRSEFRGDIYVKPARSINYIQLNFVAVRTGVEFSEIVGKF